MEITGHVSGGNCILWLSQWALPIPAFSSKDAYSAVLSNWNLTVLRSFLWAVNTVYRCVLCNYACGRGRRGWERKLSIFGGSCYIILVFQWRNRRGRKLLQCVKLSKNNWGISWSSDLWGVSESQIIDQWNIDSYLIQVTMSSKKLWKLFSSFYNIAINKSTLHCSNDFNFIITRIWIKPSMSTAVITVGFSIYNAISNSLQLPY